MVVTLLQNPKNSQNITVKAVSRISTDFSVGFDEFF